MTTLSYQSLFYIARPSGEVRNQQPWQDFGGQVQPYQPQPLRPLRRAAAMAAATGLFLVLSPPPAPPALQTADYAWFEQTPMHRASPRPRVAAVEGNSQFGIFMDAFWGWTQEYTQPPKLYRPQRGTVITKSDGIAAKFNAWKNDGWQVQSLQPPHIRRVVPTRSDDILFTVVNVLQTADYRWLETPWMYPRKNFARAASMSPKDDGTQQTFRRWLNFGFEQQAQQLQPPAAQHGRVGQFLRGDDTPQPQFRWVNDGWQILPWQPPHPRSEKAGVRVGGDGGIHAATTAILLTQDYPWGHRLGEIDYRRSQFYQSAATMRGIDGIDAVFSSGRSQVPSNLRIVYSDLTLRSVAAALSGRAIDADISSRTITADTSGRNVTVNVAGRSIDVDVTDRETST